MKYFINIHHWLDAYKDSPETYFDELLGSIRSYLGTTCKMIRLNKFFKREKS